jgi:hypothetical protein
MLALQLYVSQVTLTTEVICPQKYSSPRAAAILWPGNSNYYAC